MRPIREDRRIPLNVMMVSVGINLVRQGWVGFDLRDDYFNNANQTNLRYGHITGIDALYATAMMGGEPYAEWS